MFDYKGKIILVTGAAGNLGNAVVEEYLKANGTVVAVDRQTGRLDDNFESIDTSAKLHIFNGVDLTDRQAVMSLADDVRDQVGLVGIVVNTVGGFTAGDPIHELPMQTLQRMIDLNIKTFLNTSAGFIPHLIEKQGGKIITIGSRSSLSGGAQTGAYAAAKSALLRMTESMAAELKTSNIQANCVIPSTIDTPENRQAMPKADYSKWVKPEKIAQSILFLTSPAADAISGIALPVYGRA